MKERKALRIWRLQHESQQLYKAWMPVMTKMMNICMGMRVSYIEAVF